MLELAERVRRVRILLATLDDPYPTPRGALETEPGPAPSRYVPCETCRERGEVHVRGGWKLCLICDGNGWKRREGEPAYDAYIGVPIELAIDLPQDAPTRPVDPEISEQTYAWERVRAAYDRSGSYQELRRRLDWLSLTAPRRHALVRAVLVEGQRRELAPGSQLELDLAVVSIAMRMRTVRVPRWLLAQHEMPGPKDALVELAALGMGAGEIARRLGMSKRAVRRKLKGKAVGSRQAGIPFGAM